MFVSQRRYTPWDIDANDERTIVLANSFIRTTYQAQTFASQLLNEFDTIGSVKTVLLAGHYDIEVSNLVFIQSRAFTGIARVYTLESFTSEAGAVTRLTLDAKCPRIFGFWTPDLDNEYFYAGTAGNGVWRKKFTEDNWTAYNAGISTKDIVDLFINDGVFVCVDSEGNAYYRHLYLESWVALTKPSSGAMAVACTMNGTNNDIYVGYNSFSFTSSEVGSSLVTKYRPDASLESSTAVVIEGSSNTVILDLEHNGTELIISAARMKGKNLPAATNDFAFAYSEETLPFGPATGFDNLTTRSVTTGSLLIPPIVHENVVYFAEVGKFHKLEKTGTTTYTLPVTPAIQGQRGYLYRKTDDLFYFVTSQSITANSEISVRYYSYVPSTNTVTLISFFIITDVNYNINLSTLAGSGNKAFLVCQGSSKVGPTTQKFLGYCLEVDTQATLSSDTIVPASYTDSSIATVMQGITVGGDRAFWSNENDLAVGLVNGNFVYFDFDIPTGTVTAGFFIYYTYSANPDGQATAQLSRFAGPLSKLNPTSIHAMYGREYIVPPPPNDKQFHSEFYVGNADIDVNRRNTQTIAITDPQNYSAKGAPVVIQKYYDDGINPPTTNIVDLRTYVSTLKNDAKLVLNYFEYTPPGTEYLGLNSISSGAGTTIPSGYLQSTTEYDSLTSRNTIADEINDQFFYYEGNSGDRTLVSYSFVDGSPNPAISINSILYSSRTIRHTILGLGLIIVISANNASYTAGDYKVDVHWFEEDLAVLDLEKFLSVAAYDFRILRLNESEGLQHVAEMELGYKVEISRGLPTVLYTKEDVTDTDNKNIIWSYTTISGDFQTPANYLAFEDATVEDLRFLSLDVPTTYVTTSGETVNHSFGAGLIAFLYKTEGDATILKFADEVTFNGGYTGIYNVFTPAGGELLNHIETTNYLLPRQYVGVSISGAGGLPGFYINNPNVYTFVNHSTNLPGYDINILRVDDLI